MYFVYQGRASRFEMAIISGGTWKFLLGICSVQCWTRSTPEILLLDKVIINGVQSLQCRGCRRQDLCPNIAVSTVLRRFSQRSRWFCKDFATCRVGISWSSQSVIAPRCGMAPWCRLPWVELVSDGFLLKILKSTCRSFGSSESSSFAIFCHPEGNRHFHCIPADL